MSTQHTQKSMVFSSSENNPRGTDNEPINVLPRRPTSSKRLTCRYPCSIRLSSQTSLRGAFQYGLVPPFVWTGVVTVGLEGTETSTYGLIVLNGFTSFKPHAYQIINCNSRSISIAAAQTLTSNLLSRFSWHPLYQLRGVHTETHEQRNRKTLIHPSQFNKWRAGMGMGLKRKEASREMARLTPTIQLLKRWLYFLACVDYIHWIFRSNMIKNKK